MNLAIVRTVFLLTIVSVCHVTWANDDNADKDKKNPAAPKTIYIPLKPPFVVNYGREGRLKYLKVELSVRVKDNIAASAIRHHMPLIRNNLVLLFSRQTDEDIDTQEGKEQLRLQALEEIQKILLEEESNEEGAVDLFFNNLVIQK